MNAEGRKRLKGLFAMLAEAKEILTEKMAITRNREELYGPRVNLMAIAGAINKLATHEAISSLLDDVDRLESENAALKARVAELEGEITELTAPFSSGDPTKLTESEWARIHENVEKYAPKTPHVQVDKDGVWFIRLDLFASITEKLEARVAALEEAGNQLRATMIRPIADDVLIEKFKAAEEKWAAALDRAGEG